MSLSLIRAQQPERSSEQLGRYRLVVELGQGGMGTIHLALAGGLGDFKKLLVVKELREDLTRNQRFVRMFMDEAQLAARLNHPNVVQTLEAGQAGDRYYLSMEFLDGQPLSAILSQADATPRILLGMRLQILSEALAGLHYAHELREYDGSPLQIVHRDVSPQNIFVTYDGQVKVVDFGIANAGGAEGSSHPGVFKGTFGYASPEQVRGDVIDARTDVFAVGVILWEALTMRRFSEGEPTRSSVAARLAGAEPRLASVLPNIDPRLAAICDRAIMVDPAQRFASAHEFRAALEGYLSASGQHVDISTLRDTLCTKFAAERKAIHRLIDCHIKRGAASVSEVREARVLFGRERGNDNPTAEADLSELVHSSVETINPSDRPTTAPARRGTRMLWLAAGALALAAAFGYSRMSMLESNPPKLASLPSVAPPPPTADGPVPRAPRAEPSPRLPLTAASGARTPAAPGRDEFAPSAPRPSRPVIVPRPQPVSQPTASEPTPALAEPTPARELGAELKRLVKPERQHTIDLSLDD